MPRATAILDSRLSKVVFLLDGFQSTQKVSGCKKLNEGKLPKGKDLSKTFSKPASYKKRATHSKFARFVDAKAVMRWT